MRYDVVYVEKGSRYLMAAAVRELSKKINDICINGHEGKRGWQLQGGISVVAGDGFAYAAQAIVCHEDNDSKKANNLT